MKCDQDLCLSLRYDLKKLLWQDELNPRVRCAFGNVYLIDEMVGVSATVAEPFFVFLIFNHLLSHCTHSPSASQSLQSAQDIVY